MKEAKVGAEAEVDRRSVVTAAAADIDIEIVVTKTRIEIIHIDEDTEID